MSEPIIISLIGIAGAVVGALSAPTILTFGGDKP